jgi:hypothetical protein
MSRAANIYTGQTIPPAGSTQRPWLSSLWVVLLAGFLVVVAVRHIFPPALEFSTPTIWTHDSTGTIEFEATNTTNQSVIATLQIVVGHGTPGNNSRPPTYAELARKTLSISLRPKERKSFHSDVPLPMTSLAPNTVHIELGPASQGLP